ETNMVAEWIGRPKHPLPPRHPLNATFDNSTARVERHLVGLIEIRNGKINVLPRVVLPTSLETVTVRHGIVASKDGPTAIEVMAASRDPFARYPQDQSIELLCAFDVRDRKDDPEQPRHVCLLEWCA